MRNEEKAKEILKTSDLKITPQRIGILSIVSQLKTPFSTEDIYKLLLKYNFDYSLATVYRVFLKLEEKSIIEERLIKGKSSKLYVFNNHPEKHRHHLICTKCKKSIRLDFSSQNKNCNDGNDSNDHEKTDKNSCGQCPLDDFSKSVTYENGFELSGHSFEIYGICKKCREK